MARNLGHAVEHLHWEFWKGGFLQLSEAGGACWLNLWKTTHPPRKEGCASSLDAARACRVSGRSLITTELVLAAR